MEAESLIGHGEASRINEERAEERRDAKSTEGKPGVLRGILEELPPDMLSLLEDQEGEGEGEGVRGEVSEMIKALNIEEELAGPGHSKAGPPDMSRQGRTVSDLKWRTELLDEEDLATIDDFIKSESMCS